MNENNIPITVEVPKADVWLRADYRDIVHRLGEVHMVRACEHQHDDDFVPMYDLQTIAEYQQKAESLRLELDRAWAEIERLRAETAGLVKRSMKDAADSVVDDSAIETAVEKAYWQFDARRKGLAEWATSPQSERDAFKAEGRMLAKGFYPVGKSFVEAERDAANRALYQAQEAAKALRDDADKLRAEADRAWAEVDRCCKQLGDLTTQRKQDELVHGNIMGRIAVNLFGKQNNVTDEECVAETARLGYKQTALMQRVKGLEEELHVWQERYRRMLEWASQLKAYEPPQPIIVDADSPMVGVLTGRPCTCHPDDNPPVPCPKKYALSECKKAALGGKEAG